MKNREEKENVVGRRRWLEEMPSAPGLSGFHWPPDEIEVVEKSGGFALCEMKWEESIFVFAATVKAWIPKRHLRFER